jgi:hypothetical protein
LQRRKPNVVVALGNEALVALTGHLGIEKWRGSILASPVGKVVATLHPAFILRMYHKRIIAEFDLRRAREESSNPEVNLPQHSFIINPSFDCVMDTLLAFQKRRCKLSFDIETHGRHVRCLGLADSPSTCICIPFMSRRGAPRPGEHSLILVPAGVACANSHWGEEQELIILSTLGTILGDEDIPKIAQNFPFDSTLLLQDFGLVVRGLWMDTMVAQHCCYPELPKGLDFLCSIYTRVPYYSDYDSQDDLQTWVYNCYDASVTFECAIALEKELGELS